MAKTSRGTVTAYSLFVALKELAIALISGTNLDASAYSIPVASTSTDGALETGGNLATAVASLSVLDDWDETDRCKVNPIAGQVGVAGGAGAAGATVLRTVSATDSPEVTSLASLLAALAPTISHGVLGARFTSADQSAADAAISDAPTSGQKIVVKEVTISVDTTMRVDLKEETSGTLLHSGYHLANTTVQLRFTKKKLATVNKKLTVRTSVSGNVSVDAGYYSEA